MRRAICFAEPQLALAGQTSTWRLVFQPATNLAAGARLKFDLKSPGRGIDWEPPQVSLRAARNVIYAHMPDGKAIAAEEIDTPDSIIPQYEFELPSQLKAGESFTIVLGTPPKKKPTADNGNQAQTMVQRRRQFWLYIDPKGTGNYGDPETFSIDIRGNDLHAIRVLAPSLVGKNKRFDITVRFEDEWGNLTARAPEETLIDLSYENLRENLNWKLFVPETGFVTLPNLYFNEAGVYRIQLVNQHTKEVFVSAPVKCINDAEDQLYWGLLHGESERVDSTENIESCLRHFRDERNLNYFATSCFDSVEETSNEVWKLISQNVATFNEEERFVVALGFQWEGEPGSEGLRQFIYHKDGKSLMRRNDLKNNSLEKIYRTNSPSEMLSIPSFTMGANVGFDFKNHNPEFERVVEIYNAWGSSECLAKEGNPRPISYTGKKGVKEFPEGSVQQALRNNCRFGFVAGGLDDRGCYGDFYESEQEQYSPGATAIFAPKHNRESLVAALQARRCYATTGARIIVGLFLIGEPMGSEISVEGRRGLMVNRHISGYVAGTAPLESVEIIRNGEVIAEIDVDGPILDFTYDDMDKLSDVVLDGGEEKPDFAFYYLRVTQEDEQMAWSSPIWVDCPNQEPPVKRARSKS